MTSKPHSPLASDVTETLIARLTTLAEWLEVAKLTPNMPEPRCEHWETIVREAADRLSALHQEREKAAYVEHPYHKRHLPGCRKHIYDPKSSPCTCVGEFERLVDELRMTERRAEAVEQERDEARQERDALCDIGVLDVTGPISDPIEAFRGMAARLAESRDELKHENRTLKASAEAAAAENKTLRAQLERLAETP